MGKKYSSFNVYNHINKKFVINTCTIGIMLKNMNNKGNYNDIKISSRYYNLIQKYSDFEKNEFLCGLNVYENKDMGTYCFYSNISFNDLYQYFDDEGLIEK